MTEQAVDTTALLEKVRTYVGKPAGKPKRARDPVNIPMINHWCDAMGEKNPLHHGDDAVAPPAMIQCWTMKPYTPGEQPRMEVLDLLDAAGFVGVAATNSDIEVKRYLKPGEYLNEEVVVTDISPPKETKLGLGFFVSYKWIYRVDSGEEVGSVLFRIIKFKPPKKDPTGGPKAPDASGKPRWPRPAMTRDNLFFWEGVKEKKLLVKKCAGCGYVMHPPTPMCPKCGSFEWHTVESTGRGTIHSFVVMHHPQIPPFQYPNPIVLVDLEEGWRFTANMRDAKPEDIKIGDPVEIEFVEVEPGYLLPAFRPRQR